MGQRSERKLEYTFSEIVDSFIKSLPHALSPDQITRVKEVRVEVKSNFEV